MYDTIVITISNYQIEESAKNIANALTPPELEQHGLSGRVDATGVGAALVEKWLRNHFQGIVDSHMESLHEMLTTQDNHATNSFFDALSDHVIEVEPGCYCGGCYQSCYPVWSDREDAWVPDCHKDEELHPHPGVGDEMEIEDILRFADGDEIAKYHATIKDLHETERSIS